MFNQQSAIGATIGLGILSSGFFLPPPADLVAWVGGTLIAGTALVQARVRARQPVVVGEVYADWMPESRVLAIFCYVRVVNTHPIPMSFHSFQLVLERGGDRYQFRADLLDKLASYPPMLNKAADPSLFDIRYCTANDIRPGESAVGYLAGIFRNANLSDLQARETRLGVGAESEHGTQVKGWRELKEDGGLPLAAALKRSLLGVAEPRP